MGDAQSQVRALEPLVGEWTVEASIAPGVPARTTFAWMLGGRYLLQRAEVELPEAPDLHAVVVPHADGETYTQHYFDSRGVVRLYAMTLRDGEWTLVRERADFSPLDFAQRFTGRIEGDVIDGRWEMARDGGDWALDFELRYTRRS
jgi:hypothetical protein